MITPEVKFDYSGLQKGVNAALQYTKRSVPQMINQVAFSVAVRAYQQTKSVDVARIDSELQTVPVAVLGRRGKPLKNKRSYKAKAGTYYAKTEKMVPLPVLIMSARANPGSRYNQRTGGRWQQTSPLKGFNRELGRQKMSALIDRMIKARHSSANFIKAGFLPAVKAFGVDFRGNFTMVRSLVRGSFKSASGDQLGTATVASRESFQANASITNLIGTEGSNAQSMNKALFQFGAPALQEAMDHEGQVQMAYALKKYEQGVFQEVRKDWE